MHKLVFKDIKFLVDICDVSSGLLNVFIYIEDGVKTFSFFVNMEFEIIPDRCDLCVNVRNGKNSVSDILSCRMIDRTIRPLLDNIKLSINITCLEYGYTKKHIIYAGFLAFNYIFSPSVHFNWIEESDIDLFIGHSEDAVLSMEMCGNEISANRICDYVNEALLLRLPEFKAEKSVVIEKSDVHVCFKARCDDRDSLNIRNINIVNHHKGDSVLFTRGKTSVLTQMNYNIFGEGESVFNYEFSGSRKNRREIGHGDLIRKSFQYIIPSFMQVNSSSFVQNCDGSSSMGSVCGLSMCLSNLGCVNKLVAGVTVGSYFIRKNALTYIVDMTAAEDANISNMDFKCSGTIKGFNAIQMDCKYVVKHNFQKIFKIAKSSLVDIIDKMKSKVFKVNQFFKEYALDATRIGVLIGTNGKKIKKISACSNAMIRVSKTGLCVVKQEDFKIFEEFYHFYNYCSIVDNKLVCSLSDYKGNFSLVLKEKYDKKSKSIHTAFGEILLHKLYAEDIQKDEAICCSVSDGQLIIKKVY
jgi:hypothetical protein